MESPLTFIDGYKVLALIGDGGQAKYTFSLFLVSTYVPSIWNCMPLRFLMLASARGRPSTGKPNSFPCFKNIIIWLKCIMPMQRLLSQMLMALNQRNQSLCWSMLKMEISLNIFLLLKLSSQTTAGQSSKRSLVEFST